MKKNKQHFEKNCCRQIVRQLAKVGGAFALFIFISMSVFAIGTVPQTTDNIDKTLNDINTRFKNVQVSIVNWPDDLLPKLGKLKESAFMTFPKKELKGKLPLLISLHGAGGKAWSIEEQLARSAKVKGLSLAELSGKELILIEPNSYDNWDPQTLDIMLDYVLTQYPQIDSTRIYVMGHSMGGRGTWDWIQHSSGRFAAAAPCGFSGVGEDDEIQKLSKLPIWGMVGAKDLRNVESVKKMVNLLKASGNPNVRYTAFPEADHAAGNARVFAAVDWINWMLTFSIEK